MSQRWSRQPHRRQPRTVVEVFEGEAQRARGNSRNTKVRPVGMEEACSSGGELGLGASHGGSGGRLQWPQLG